jgi:ABC-type glycerol-3-phosphate transport system substrate-binding protein
MKARRIVGIALILGTLAAGVVWARGNQSSNQTISGIALGNVAGGAIKEIAANYAKDHPGFELDLTSLDGVTDFWTALSAKIAARDIPDIMYLQWDTTITKYAQNGYLTALDDLGLDSKLVNAKKKINVINGKTYAYPGIQTVYGMFWNQNLAKKYGVDYVPQTLDQLFSALETIKQNGLDRPYLLPGQDLSGVTAFMMAYMHQRIAGQDPLFYYKIATGEKSWTGPEIREMYANYSKILTYAPDNYLGIDPEEQRRRFAREEAVVNVGGSGGITQYRQMNPNFDFILAPAMTAANVAGYNVIADFDAGFAVGAMSPAERTTVAKDFFKYLYEPASAEIFANAMGGLSPVLAAKPKYDPSINIDLPYIAAGNFVGFSERDWVPGIRDVMKKNTQDWMSGAMTLDQALTNLAAEHQRLLDANPTYVEELRQLLVSIGLLK